MSSDTVFSQEALASIRAGFERCALPRDATVAVAVSGGVDSMTLLALCHALVTEERLREIIALHINHSIRPAVETEQDLQLVRNYCDAHAIPLAYAEITREEVMDREGARNSVIRAAHDRGQVVQEQAARGQPAQAPEQAGTQAQAAQGQTHAEKAGGHPTQAQPAQAHRDGGLEARARHARLRCFASILQDRRLQYLCTAHHRDDNAETVLMRLLGGGGINGLVGISPAQQMRAITDSGCRYEYTLVRPLLAVSKAEIVSWARATATPYREDSSNQDNRILRNAIRHDLLPSVSHQFPQYYRALERIAEQTTVWQEYINEQHCALLQWEACPPNAQDSGRHADHLAIVPNDMYKEGAHLEGVVLCWRIRVKDFFHAHKALQFQSFYTIANRLNARRRLPYRFVRQCLTAFARDYCGERGSGHGLRCHSDRLYLYLAKATTLQKTSGAGF